MTSFQAWPLDWSNFARGTEILTKFGIIYFLLKCLQYNCSGGHKQKFDIIINIIELCKTDCTRNINFNKFRSAWLWDLQWSVIYGPLIHLFGVSGSVGWGTTPQERRFLVRFPVESLCPHSVALGSNQPLKDEYERISLEVKCGRRLLLTAKPSQLCRMSL